MEKRKILESLVNYYTDGNKAQFAHMIGITPQLLSNWIKRNTIDYDMVYKGCKNLSGDFLLSGEGDIIRQNTHSVNIPEKEELLPLCKSLIENYQQRDEIIVKLVSMVENAEKQ